MDDAGEKQLATHIAQYTDAPPPYSQKQYEVTRDLDFLSKVAMRCDIVGANPLESIEL